MKIATWNVNGIRPRAEQVSRFLAETQPDLLCVQEIKVMDELFPGEAFAEAGWAHQLVVGQKAHHGVAILSRIPFEPLERQVFAGIDDKRYAGVRLASGLEVHNFYFPSGGADPDAEANPKFAHKLAFFHHVTDWLKETRTPEQPLLMLGDFNVAPLEQDVWNHKRLRRSIGHTDGERALMADMLASLNMIDAPRHFVPADQPLYSWWGYRFKESVQRDYGWRLDHAWITPEVQPFLISAQVLKHTRLWDKPSDHVPVVVELKDV